MEGLCRGCLSKFNEPNDLLQYSESNRRLFVYSTGLQVKRNDTLTFQLCKECFLSMKLACKFKKQCRTSDKIFKNYLALKEDRDSEDFSTYLKNFGDTFNLRLPIVSSTPTHRRNEDDDNESTCTSIQNFMTDMLEGEEMPPTEDRIIREVIQEEADILDDSLDSHWMQEDNMSIDNDFRMDFNFGMSTPRSINNDHCYTPRRLTDDKEVELNYYTSKNIIERCNEPKIVQHNDMPILDDCGLKFDDVAVKNIEIGNLETDYSIKKTNIAQNNDMPVLDDCDIEFDGVFDGNITLGELETGYSIEPDKEHIPIKEKSHNCDTFIHSSVTKIIAEDDPFAKLDSIKHSLFSVSNNISHLVNSENVSMANENEISIILNTGIADEKVSNSPLTCELEHYMNKVEIKKTKNTIKENKRKKALSNEKDICVLLDQYEVDKTINQSQFTQELEEYINKSTLKKNNDLESNLGDKELSIFRSGTDYTNNFKQPGKEISVTLNQTKNVEDSPIKHELELYMNKAKLKKESKQAFNHNTASVNYVNEQCSIDRNLELALKNGVSQEFSLDQLLDSPQVSLRSAASTPTINNILFGGTTPRDANVVSKFVDSVNIQENDSTYCMEEFLKFEDCKQSTTPRQQLKNTGESKHVKNKDINAKFKLEDAVKIQEVNPDFMEEFLKDDDNNLQSAKERSGDQIPKAENKQVNEKVTNSLTETNIQETDRTGFIENLMKNENRKRYSKPMKGFKDQAERKRGKGKPMKGFIDQAEKKRSKDLKKAYQIYDEKSERKRKTEKHSKFDNEFKKFLSIQVRPFDTDELLENDKPNSLKDETIDVKEKEVSEKTVSNENGEDLDISVTSLLNFDDNQSVDLNFSISSDFIKDTDKLDYSDIDEEEQTEYVFKRPFTPPDNKYDIDQCLCKICDKKYNSSKSLKMHLCKTHKLKLIKDKRLKKTYTRVLCQICGKSFRDKSNYNKHVKTHNVSDIFKCKFCTLEFSTRGSLSKHMKVHTNQFKNKEQEDNNKKIVCSTCGKKFSNIGNYNVHQKRHTKSYAVTCDDCQQGFYRKSDLRLHMRIHTGDEVKFQCKLCPRVYRRRSLLVGHMYRHMNKMDFECEACKVKFVDKILLQRHYNTKFCTYYESIRASNDKSNGTQEVEPTEKIREVIETKLTESNTEYSETSDKLEAQSTETEEISKIKAKVANKKSDGTQVSVTTVVGSNEKIREVIETKLKESNTENSETNEKLETQPTEIEGTENVDRKEQVKVGNIETVEISTEIFIKLEEIPPSSETMEVCNFDK